MVRQQESMQSEMAKVLQTPVAPLTELARKNLELWEQMQAATRDAFMGRPEASSTSTGKTSEQDEAERARDSKRSK
jgi:hypothetical protein